MMDHRPSETVWVPACAGKEAWGAHSSCLSCRSTNMPLFTLSSVFPAKAGIQMMDHRPSDTVWVPTFAGKEEGD